MEPEEYLTQHVVMEMQQWGQNQNEADCFWFCGNIFRVDQSQAETQSQVGMKVYHLKALTHNNWLEVLVTLYNTVLLSLMNDFATNVLSNTLINVWHHEEPKVQQAYW